MFLDFYEYLETKRSEVLEALKPYNQRIEDRERAGMNSYGVATPKDKELLRNNKSILDLQKKIKLNNNFENLKNDIEEEIQSCQDKTDIYNLERQLQYMNEYSKVNNKSQSLNEFGYDINKLPDFFSVRNYDQIDYSMEGMEGKKCYCFLDNGFSSNIIEPNKRDIKFIWDGFILFTDPTTTLEDIQNGIDLYNSRLVALQRTNVLGKKANTEEIKEYILKKLEENNNSIEIMEDKKDVSGYPSKCDLWSTRDSSVLIDVIDNVKEGESYYFKNADFHYSITFNKSNIPSFNYSHQGALVLRGENNTAIARLICNDKNLQEYLESTIGEEKMYSYLEGKEIPGTTITDIKNKIV